MNRREVAEVLAVLAAVDAREPSEAALAVWADALADVDARDAALGVRLMLRDETRYATPALLRQYVKRRRALARDEAGRRAQVEAAQRDAVERTSCEDCDADGYRLDRPLKRCRHDGWKPGGLARARQELESG